jgi:hypothetical protein
MELEISQGAEPGTYVVEVLRSVGGGEPKATFSLDVEELLDRRQALEDSVLSSSVAARRIMPATEVAIQGVGRLLFESVFRDDVETAYRTSLAVASDRGAGVQIVLRLTAPGLAALPWEALYDPETGSYLCRKEPLVRYVPAPYSPPTLALTPPLRVLCMISSPRGLPPLDVEGEKELLEQALRPHIDGGRVQVDWLEQVTWSSVHDKLLEQEWHVLHFIGHGTYDTETDEGVLAFVGRDGRADYVAASALADLLAEAEPTPRLVLLNSCRSGAGGGDDLFSGTAAALVHSGIHAVAAMQFSVSDPAAIEFARGFYAALAHGRGIDEAVRSGRIGMLGVTRGSLEWVTPVLYLRGDDTRLFEVAATSNKVPVPPQPTPAPAPSEPPPTPTPTVTRPTPPSVPERPSPAPSLHSADTGDLPATLIPIVRPDAAAGTAPTPIRSGAPPSTSGSAPSPVDPTGPPQAPTPTAGTSAVPTTTPSDTHAVPPAPPPRTPIPPPPPPTDTHAVPPTPTPPPPPPRTDETDDHGGGRRRLAPWLIALIVVLAVVIGGGIVYALVPKPAPTPDGSGNQSSGEPAPTPRTIVTVPGGGPDVDTGIQCAAGEVVAMSATGTVDQDTAVGDPLFGPDGYTGPPAGYKAVYPEYAPGALVGGLLPVDGTDTFGAFADDGTGTGTYRLEYTCPAAGTIWLGINDPVLFDNAGGFEVSIW